MARSCETRQPPTALNGHSGCERISQVTKFKEIEAYFIHFRTPRHLGICIMIIQTSNSCLPRLPAASLPDAFPLFSRIKTLSSIRSLIVPIMQSTTRRDLLKQNLLYNHDSQGCSKSGYCLVHPGRYAIRLHLARRCCYRLWYSSCRRCYYSSCRLRRRR